MKASRLRRRFNFDLPLMSSGRRVPMVQNDFRRIRVELREHGYSGNDVGPHVGGSVFAMTNPFWMIMLLRNIGPGHAIGDNAAEIEFVSPGRGTMSPEFALDPALSDPLWALAAGGAKLLHWLEMCVGNAPGAAVAQRRKQVQVLRGREPAPA